MNRVCHKCFDYLLTYLFTYLSTLLLSVPLLVVIWSYPEQGYNSATGHFRVAGPVAWNQSPTAHSFGTDIINVQKHAQDTSFLTFLLHWLTTVSQSSSSEHCTAPHCSDSSHVTAPYKFSFYYFLLLLAMWCDWADVENADCVSGSLHAGVSQLWLGRVLANDEHSLACVPTHSPLLRQGPARLHLLSRGTVSEWVRGRVFLCDLCHLAVVSPLMGPPRFSNEGGMGMTKSWLACVYCVQLFRFIELYWVVHFFVWFCLLVH